MNSQNQNPEQQQQRLESYQEQLLTQYSELFEQSVYDAAEQALNDRLANAEAIAIRKAFGRFKEHSQQMLQGRLQELNQHNAGKIIQLRAEMPTVEELDDSPALEMPSLKSGLDDQMKNYGVLTGSADDGDLPSDLTEALEA